MRDWGLRMLACFLASLVAGSLAAAGELRTFWKIEEGPRTQPLQVEVAAELIREGTHLKVFRERGYRFSTLGEADEEKQASAAIDTFDTAIYPILTDAVGPCPDLDGNRKVILLIARFSRETAAFSPFDQMSDEEAQRYGFRSNQGEILYHSFGLQGNHAPGNVSSLAFSFSLLLDHARDPRETAWSMLLAGYGQFLCGLATPRALWGDALPGGIPIAADAPWSPAGWPLLFIHYLRERRGLGLLHDLAASPELGLAGLEASLHARGDSSSAADLLADFAMACWLSDPVLGAGRFSFATITAPRPPAAARVPASRPNSGQLSCGVGGMVHLVAEGDGDRPLPVALRGDPSVRWIGRAVHLRQRGPDEEMELAFSAEGLARLDLPLLPAGDAVAIAVVPVPAPAAEFDRRTLTLLWGLGWVPRPITDQGRTAVAAVAERVLPDHGSSAGGRLLAVVKRLAGASPASDRSVIATRYACAPESTAVVDALLQEASSRNLKTQISSFLRTAPNGTRQEWRNLLIELPGDDPRRWPVVLAAHWDASRATLTDSYLRALNADDNASGVAVALEVAATLSRFPRRAPILVAFLAGGCHDTAGAHALLEQLAGKITAWLELDAVGRPAAPPRPLTLRIEGATERAPLTLMISQAVRAAGLSPASVPEISSPHTGASLAAARGIPAFVIRSRDAAAVAADPLTPPSVELEQISPELMALVSKALASATEQIAGAPR